MGEAVGNDPGAASKARQDRLVEMVDTGGGEQERLADGVKLAREAGKNRLAQRLGARRPSRLACPNNGDPQRREAFFEPLGLNRLAHALAALERDETASRLRGHRRLGRGAPSASSPIQSHRTKPTAGPSAKRRFKLPPTPFLSMVGRGLATRTRCDSMQTWPTTEHKTFLSLDRGSEKALLGRQCIAEKQFPLSSRYEQSCP